VIFPFVGTGPQTGRRKGSLPESHRAAQKCRTCLSAPS